MSAHIIAVSNHLKPVGFKPTRQRAPQILHSGTPEECHLRIQEIAFSARCSVEEALRGSPVAVSEDWTYWILEQAA